MERPALKLPGTFVSWERVRFGFMHRHWGIDPLFNTADGWLAVAAHAAETGQLGKADAYLAAGLVREAYDRDTYEPPAQLQNEFGPTHEGE